MSVSDRIAAVVAYLPVVGWLYVLLTQRRNALAMFHLRQAIGLVAFLVAILAGWVVIAWLFAWIPFLLPVSVALFALVTAAYLFGAALWVLGAVNAARGRAVMLPVFGAWASRIGAPVA
jgi:uncharacterized membrane protein